MFVAKGLGFSSLTSGGTMSSLAGARYNLPIQYVQLAADISSPITFDNNNNHKYIKLDISNRNIAGNGSTAVVNNNSNAIDVQVIGSGKITGGAISGGDFSSGASVSSYQAGTGTTIPVYGGAYGTAQDLTYDYGGVRNVDTGTDSTNTALLRGSDTGTFTTGIGGNSFIGFASGGGAGSWWGNEGSDGGNSGAFILAKKNAPIGTRFSYYLSQAGNRTYYQGSFGGPRGDAAHGHHGFAGLVTTGNIINSFVNNTSSATITFQETHGLSVDDTFTVERCSTTNFNRTYKVTSVTNTKTVVAAPFGNEVYTAPTFSGTNKQDNWNNNAAAATNGLAIPGLLGTTQGLDGTNYYSTSDFLDSTAAYITLVSGQTYNFTWTVQCVSTFGPYGVGSGDKRASVCWPGQGRLERFASNIGTSWHWTLQDGTKYGGAADGDFLVCNPGVHSGDHPDAAIDFEPHVYWQTRSGNPSGLTFTGWSNGSSSQADFDADDDLPGTQLTHTVRSTAGENVTKHELTISGTVSETTEIYIFAVFGRRTTTGEKTLVATMPPRSEVSFVSDYNDVTKVTESGAPVSIGQISGSYDFDATTGPGIQKNLSTDFYLKLRGGGGGRWIEADQATAVGQVISGDGGATTSNLGADAVVAYQVGTLGDTGGQANGSGSPLVRNDGSATQYPHRTGGAGNTWTPTDYGWGSGGGDQTSDNNNSGAPGAIWVYNDVAQTINFDGDPWDVIASFGGSATSLSSTGIPTDGITLTNFTGQFTRSG